MTSDPGRVVDAICESFGRERSRMMDIVLAVQSELGSVDADAIDARQGSTAAPPHPQPIPANACTTSSPGAIIPGRWSIRSR